MPRRASLLLLPLLALAQPSCGRAPAPRETEISGRTMGTTYAVRLAGPGALDASGLARAISEELNAVDARLSTWRADSEVSRLNAARTTDWFPLSAATVEVLACARRTSTASSGAFDVTVLPLVNAWGFGAAPALDWPTDAGILQALEDVGWRLLELRESPPAARKQRPGVAVDCSALGKGYAVDRVVALLLARGLTDFLVEVGGELGARGRHLGGEPWVVGIEAPQAGPPSARRAVRLDDRGLATSGDYRRSVTHDGRRISHLLDPRTGRPIGDALASATVIHPEAMVADAWATALMVLGPEEGLAVARREGLAVLLLARQGGSFVEWTTPGFDACVVQGGALSSGGARSTAGRAGEHVLLFVLGFALVGLAAGALALRLRASRPASPAACPLHTDACPAGPCSAALPPPASEPSDVRHPAPRHHP